MQRRDFLQGGALLALVSSCSRHRAPSEADSLSEVVRRIASGEVSAADYLKHYLLRIDALDRAGPELRAVIELHARRDRLAHALPSGLLHGAPVLIKDNIETADGMLTTAGSLALVDAPPPKRDAFIVRRLREAGALIFGKTNLSEWANIRSRDSTSGWSARGGLTRHPRKAGYNASGSSSGSAVAVAAGLCAAAVGTETNGSIVSPASACGIVGLKPTLGSLSRGGIIPISHWQDTAGPMTRTVRDAALMMEVMAAHDPGDPLSSVPPTGAVTGYSSLFHAEVLRGKRLGVVRELCGGHPGVLARFDHVLKLLRQAGAEVVENVELPNQRAAAGLAWRALLTEFRADLNAYLRQRGGRVGSLQALIAFNREHAAEEMPWFGQDLFEEAEKRGTPEALAEAAESRALARRLAGPEGIDAALQSHRLDALICPTNDPTERIDLRKGDADVRVACTPAAVAGYPHLTLPMGAVDGLPLGFSFFGSAWSDPLLLALGDALEARLAA